MRLSELVSLLALPAMIIFGAGCPSQSTTRPITPPVRPNPEAVLQADPILRVDVISRRLQMLQDRAKQLPGDSEEKYRSLMAEVFTDLATILPSLEGPDSSGAFRQQLRVIQGSSSELGSMRPELSSEPAVAAGLRAAYNALAGINTRQFANLPSILKTLNEISAKLDQLDTTHGSAFREVVAQDVQLSGQVMQEMNQALVYRLGQSTRPMTATEPALTRPSGE